MKTIRLAILSFMVMTNPGWADPCATLVSVVNSAPGRIQAKIGGSPNGRDLVLAVDPKAQGTVNLLWMEPNNFSTDSLIEANISYQTSTPPTQAYCQLRVSALENGFISKQLYAVITVTATSPGNLSCSISSYKK